MALVGDKISHPSVNSLGGHEALPSSRQNCWHEGGISSLTLKQMMDSFSRILHCIPYYVKATKIEKKNALKRCNSIKLMLCLLNDVIDFCVTLHVANKGTWKIDITYVRSITQVSHMGWKSGFTRLVCEKSLHQITTHVRSYIYHFKYAIE